MRALYFTFITILISSCSIFLGNTKSLKSEKYSSHFNQSNWKEVDPDLSDLAYTNTKTGSIILFNSLCKKYDNSSLTNLQKNLLSGLDNIRIINREDVSLYNRKAIKLTANARLDGVLVYLDVYTVKKNRCVYDFVLISSSQNKIAIDRNDFQVFLKKMRID